eukprot:SAG22_NODE_784_length_7228_cov_10.581620_2_plen_409_part_00
MAAQPSAPSAAKVFGDAGAPHAAGPAAAHGVDSEVGAWLAAHGLEEYAGALAAAGYNRMLFLATMGDTEASLLVATAKMPTPHARMFNHALQALRGPGGPAAGSGHGGSLAAEPVVVLAQLAAAPPPPAPQPQRPQPLPGGMEAGDFVVSLVDEAGKLARGDIGTVKGPATSTGEDAARRVLVSFPNWPAVNVLGTQVRTLQKGDVVVLASSLPNLLQRGAVGKILGGGSSAGRVRVKFNRLESMVNVDVSLLRCRGDAADEAQRRASAVMLALFVFASLYVTGICVCFVWGTGYTWIKHDMCGNADDDAMRCGAGQRYQHTDPNCCALQGLPSGCDPPNDLTTCNYLPLCCGTFCELPTCGCDTTTGCPQPSSPCPCTDPSSPSCTSCQNCQVKRHTAHDYCDFRAK